MVSTPIGNPGLNIRSHRNVRRAEESERVDGLPRVRSACPRYRP